MDVGLAFVYINFFFGEKKDKLETENYHLNVINLLIARPETFISL